MSDEQTVRNILDRQRAIYTPSSPAYADATAARAALDRMAALLLDMADTLRAKLEHPDHVSDEVRREQNYAILALLARLDDVTKPSREQDA